MSTTIDPASPSQQADHRPAPADARAATPGTVVDDDYRLLADNIPTLAWIADADGYIF